VQVVYSAVSSNPLPGSSVRLAKGRLARRLPRLQGPSQNSAKLRQRSSGSYSARFCVTAVAEEQTSAGSRTTVDWDKLGFGLQDVAPTMYVANYTPEAGWSGTLQPYGALEMSPAAQVLNYGQSIFEGMKARRATNDTIVLFRPDKNAERFQAGADRLCMPQVPTEMFVSAVKELVQANSDYVPPGDKGSLYIRPLLMGTGPILGLGPAPSYTFCIFAAAVGAYFKGGQLSPIDLLVETKFHRAAPGGMGGTKAAGNYSPVLVTQMEAKKEGYSDVVYLDAKTDTYLEEVSSCNIFVVKGKSIATPSLEGTILPGVTRRSVIELAKAKGYTVEERPVAISEAMEADEVFTTGTAVVLCAVGSITYLGEKKCYGTSGEPTPVALELYEALTGLQDLRLPDPDNWVVPVAGA